MDIFCWNIDGQNKEREFSFLHDIIMTNRFCTFLINAELEKFSLLEKYVFDLAMFHFNRLDITFDKNKHYIQFWWKNQFTDNNFHVDCDKYDLYVNNKMTYPLLSCITYINENNYPTAITNITQSEIGEKKIQTIPDFNYIYLSYPKKYKHIAFNGKKYHGMINLTNNDNFKHGCRLILCMNLLDSHPKNVPYYDSNLHNNHFLEQYSMDVSNILFSKEEKIFSLHSDSSISTFEIENALTKNFYENIFFSKNISSKQFFSELLEKMPLHHNSHSIIIKSKKHANLLDVPINISFPNFLTKTICNWLVNEIKNVYENNETITTFVNSIKLLILNKINLFDVDMYCLENVKIIHSNTENVDYAKSLKFQIVLSGQNKCDLIIHNNDKTYFNENNIFLIGNIRKM
jgi:hypothetical protein